MGKLNGFGVLASVGSSTATKVPFQTESSLSLTAETEDVTTKDSAKNEATGYLYKDEEVSGVSGEMTCTCYKDDATQLGIEIASAVKWSFVSGKDTYGGDGLVTSIQESGSVSGKATVQITVKAKGAISHTATA